MLKRVWKPLVLFIVIGVMGGSLYSQIKSRNSEIANLGDLSTGIGTGQLAPDFMGTTVEGDTVRLSEFRGKIVLVNDFATWCGPCLAETPHLVDIYNSQGGDIEIIGLNLQESESAVLDYQSEFNISYPLVMDPNAELTEIYRPIGLPTSWFIDPDGVIRYVHAGPMTTPMLQEAFDAVREGREPDVFSVVN